MTSWLVKLIISVAARRVLVGATSFFLACSALANPVVDNVAAGQVSIQQTQSTTTVNQASQKAIINWQSFNIGAQEATHFQQPAGGVALNRISPNQGASQIYGHLTATGQIILMNPAGIYFGPSAFVNVGSLIATTHNITDANFLSGNYQFNKVDPYSGAIINEGTIIAAQHGLVALVAPSVVNNGMIQANMGKVVLATGNAFTMSFDGNGLVNFVIDEATMSRGVDKNGIELSDGVKNTGSIIANGGTIMVTGRAASGVLDRVINMEGIAQAQSVGELNGTIILSAETDINNDNVVRLAGGLDASGKLAGEKGGNVTILSKYILLDNGANIDVSGDSGGGNVWIGGNYKGSGPLPNATATLMAPTAVINADAITNGNGGEVILWADDYTIAYGSISARGGAMSGDGGFIETSGKNYLDVNGISINTLAPLGETGLWLLDPTDITISTDSTTNITSGASFPFDFAYRPTTNATPDSVLNVTTLTTQLASTDVAITTESGSTSGGNIYVNSNIVWNSSNDLTLFIQSNASYGIYLNADILNSGTGGFTIGGNPSSGTLPIYLYKGGPDGSPTPNVINNRTIQAGYVSFDGQVIGANGTQTLTVTINSGGSSSTSSFNLNTANTDLNVVLNMPSTHKFSGDLSSSTGNLTINGGIFESFNGVDVLPTTSTTITIASGAYLTMFDNDDLNFTGRTVLLGGTIAILGANSGIVNDLAGSITLTDANAGISLGYDPYTGNNSQMSSFTIANTFSGTGGLTISANAGALDDVTVTGTSTYTGSTTINLTDIGSYVIPLYFSDITATNSNFGDGTTINLLGGALIYTGPTATVARTLSLGTSGELSLVTQTNPVTWSGQITGGDANNTIFMVNYVDNSTPIFGGNTITISNTGNDFAANRLVGSSLHSGASGVIPDTVTISGSITFNDFNETVGNIEDDTYGLNLNLGSATLTFGGNNLSTSLNNFITISGTNGDLVKQGTGTTTFTGGTTSYTGTTDINDGTILLSSSGTLGSGTITVNSGGTLRTDLTTLSRAITLNGGTLLSNSGTRTMSGAITLTGNNSTITANAGQFNITGGINGANTLFTSGAGTIQFGTTAIGGTTAPTALTTSASGATIIATNITTAGTQDYNNATSVSGTRTLNANGVSSDVTFDNTLSLGTSGNLTVNAGRNIVFNGAVSQTSGGSLTLNAVDAAQSITTGASGTFNISNFTITNGRWYQLGTLPSFTITNDFNIAAADGFLRATGGDGTSGTPYQIADEYGLQGIATSTLLSSSFIQTADITASGTSTWNSGAGFVPIGTTGTPYTGQFNGAGYTIDGLTINRSTDYLGLFGVIGNGASAQDVLNVGLTNASITGQSGADYIGILAGQNSGGTVVTSYTTGGVTSANSATRVGGLIGENAGTINNAYNQANISGGSSSDYIGGLVGNNTGTIDRTYNSGTVSATGTNLGRLVGANSGTVNNSYYDTTIGGSVSGSAAGTGRTTTEMQTQSPNFYVTNGGWDFSTPIWRFTGAGTYPILNVFDPVTFRIISGSLSITDGTVIRLLADGVSKGTTTISSNAFSFNINFGDISDSANLLLFVDDAGSFANTYAIAPTSNGNLTGLVMTLNSLHIDATVSATNNTNLIAAKGAYSDTDILFGGSGANLVLGSAASQTVALTTTGSSTYTADGTISNFDSSIVSSINFAGPTVINGTSITTRDNQSYAAITLGTGVTLTSNNGSIGATGNISGSGNSLTISNATSGTISGAMSNLSGFTKIGGGTLTLSGNNTYTGDTTINAGTLSIACTSCTSTSSALIVGADGTFSFAGFYNTDFSYLSGSGTLALGAGALGLNRNGAFSSEFSGTISGTNGAPIWKNGTDTLILSGANTFTGFIVLDGGTLTAANANALGTTASGVILNPGATLLINNVAIGAEAIDASGGTISGTGTASLSGNITMSDNTILNAVNSSDLLTLSGVISGTNNIVKSGSGTVSMTGVNTYTGSTTINAGVLSVNSLANGGSNSSIGASSSAAANLVLGGGTLQYTGGTQASDRAFTLTNSTTSIFDITTGATTLTFSGASANTSGALTKAGSGTLALTGVNQYTGITTINAGTLSIAADSGLGTAPGAATPGHLTIAGGTLQTTAGFTLSSNRGLALGTGGGTIQTDTGTLTYNGVITGSTALTKTGAGTLVLGGNSSAFSGGVNLNAGTLIPGHNSGFGTGTLTINGGTLSTNSTRTISNNISLATNLAIIGNNSLTLAGVISGNFGINFTGGSLLSLTGTNDYTGATNINGNNTGGGLYITSDRSLGAVPGSPTQNSLVFSGDAYLAWDDNITLHANRGITLNAGNNSLAPFSVTGGVLTINGIIEGAGNLIVEGDYIVNQGRVTLAGVNTYTGSTSIIQEGILSISADSNLGAAPGTPTAGHLTIDDNSELITTSTFELNANRGLHFGATDNFVYMTQQAGTTLTYNGIIASDNSPATQFEKWGTGTLILGGNNTYNFATDAVQGIIEATHANAFGNAVGDASNSWLWAENGATIRLNGVTINKYVYLTGAGASGAGGSLISAGTAGIGATGTVDLFSVSPTIAGTGTLTIAAPIVDTSASNLGIVKAGNSTLVLSGTNTYLGSTTINAGILSVSSLADGGINSNIGASTNAAGNLVLGGGTLQYTGGTQSSNRAFTLTNSTSSTFDITQSGTILTFSGASASTSGALIKVGAGTLALNGNNAFSNGVTLNAGTLIAGHNSAFGTGTLTLSGGTLQASGTRTLGNIFVVSNASQIGDGSTINFTNTGTINSTLTIANTASTTFLNDIDGTSGVTQSAGTVTLSGNNTFAGAIQIDGGTLNAESAAALGNTTGITTVNSGGILAVINSTALNAESITLNGGALNSTGTSSVAGAITLASSTSNTMSAGGTFTIGNNINGAGALSLGGAGSYVINGNIGNSTPITSLTTSSAATLAGDITTVNNQTFGAAVTLGANKTFTSNSGAIAFSSTLNGGFDLALASSSGTTFDGAVGLVSALNSLTISSGALTVNGGAIRTVNSQSYNINVALGADTTFSTTGTGSVTLALNNGVSGNRNIILAGAASANQSFVFGGTLTANNITVNGGASGNNSLTVNTGVVAQSWTINASNGGSLSGASGVGGTFNFSNVGSLTGGTGNDNFTLSGGTLAGAIAGGAGTNTLTAGNVANTWNLSGTNAATSITGVSGGFSNIQNLVGGNSSNNFIFANGAMITGTISGNPSFVNDATNILDFSAYSTLVNAFMTSSGSEFVGNVKNSGNSMIANYINIDSLIGNVNTDNTLTLPSGKGIGVVSFNTSRSGSIGDPLHFLNFRIIDLTPVPNTSSTTSTTSPTVTLDVAQVVQQPSTSASTNANAPASSTAAWVDTSTSLNQNMTEITTQASESYDSDLDKLIINPFCTTTSN